MAILNCLAHAFTPEQLQEIGDRSVTALKDRDPELFAILSNCPDEVGVLDSAVFRLMSIGDEFEAVILPIGSPAFMFRFAAQLGLYKSPELFDRYYFAHSVREAVDMPQPDGSVKKTNVFRHIRFFNQKGSSL